MIRILRLFLFTASVTGFATAHAYPTLADITGVAGADYTDIGAEAATLTDTDGTKDDVTAFLLFEFAGYAPTTSFGIYDYSYNDTNVLVGETLEVFDGAATPTTGWVVEFDLAAGTATSNGETANIGKSFGFYIHVGETGHTFYSHSSLNGDGFDHALVFDTSDHAFPQFMGSDLVIAWEDLFGGGDQDFNDMVVGINDVAAVPEPGTLALFGVGLLAMGAFRRRVGA